MTNQQHPITPPPACPMTDLSPAAQAVYDAFNRVGLYKDPSFETDREALAAALREVATQFSYEVHCSGEGWYELVVDASDLYAIADELGGAGVDWVKSY